MKNLHRWWYWKINYVGRQLGSAGAFRPDPETVLLSSLKTLDLVISYPDFPAISSTTFLFFCHCETKVELTFPRLVFMYLLYQKVHCVVEMKTRPEKLNCKIGMERILYLYIFNGRTTSGTLTVGTVYLYWPRSHLSITPGIANFDKKYIKKVLKCPRKNRTTNPYSVSGLVAQSSPM